MSSFFITNLSEGQYIKKFKESYLRFKDSQFILEMLLKFDPDEVGIDGRKIHFSQVAQLIGHSWVDEYVLDSFQDNDEFIEKYFDGEFTIEDYFNRNPKYMNTPLFMYLFLDDRMLQFLLEEINNLIVEETEFGGDPNYWQSLKRCVKRLIRVKKKGLNVCYRLY